MSIPNEVTLWKKCNKFTDWVCGRNVYILINWIDKNLLFARYVRVSYIVLFVIYCALCPSFVYMSAVCYLLCAMPEFRIYECCLLFTVHYSRVSYIWVLFVIYCALFSIHLEPQNSLTNGLIINNWQFRNIFSIRVVPLTHYGFLTTTESIFKKILDL